jgi:hypothetical protein
MAVVHALQEGRREGYDVPNPADDAWLHVVEPHSMPSEWLTLDLGAGELAALALAFESAERVIQHVSRKRLRVCLNRLICRMHGSWPALKQHMACQSLRLLSCPLVLTWIPPYTDFAGRMDWEYRMP